jgi:hypothetical protein
MIKRPGDFASHRQPFPLLFFDPSQTDLAAFFLSALANPAKLQFLHCDKKAATDNNDNDNDEIGDQSDPIPRLQVTSPPPTHIQSPTIHKSDSPGTAGSTKLLPIQPFSYVFATAPLNSRVSMFLTKIPKDKDLALCTAQHTIRITQSGGARN